MFFLKKLATSLILPPGIFIIILGIIAFLVKENKNACILAIITALFLYLLSIEPVKDFLISPLERSFNPSETLDANVIVVVGGGVYDSGFLKEDSINRLLAGYLIYKKTRLPIILSGGVSGDKLSDSKVMAKILSALGVEADKIIEESKSRTTFENALYTSQICKSRGFKRIILVTSAYHMKRASILFKKIGLEVVHYPTDYKANMRYTVYSFLPKISSFTNSTKAIREHISLLML